MFNFLLGIDDYEDRKVAHWEDGPFVIDTAAVPDGDKPYETGIQDPRYREEGLWVIVEAYDSKEAAEAGHQKWIDLMVGNDMPNPLVDCQNAEISKLLSTESITFWRKD